MRISWPITLVSAWGLPVVAALVTGDDLKFLLEFPPELDRVTHRPFSPGLTLLAFLVLGASGLTWILLRSRHRFYRHSRVNQRRHFPKWGYAGYVLLVLAWILAWSRFPFFEPLQAYTFTPVWLGFIVVVNAHVHRMSNAAPLYKSRGKFLALFFLSAAFWWGFEYLNRFSENWVYTGVDRVSAAHYYLHGTLCFSTVLPAVYSVFKWIDGIDAMHRSFYLGPKVPFLKNKAFGWICLLTGWGGMAGLAILPVFCYPFLWLGPVLVYGGLRVVSGKTSGISGWARGDWRWVAFWACAGLICGFFWEFWNIGSRLHWEYRVSFFNGWRLFEMPLLGYAGYLPFGIFCGLVTRWIFPREASVQFSPNA